MATTSENFCVKSPKATTENFGSNIEQEKPFSPSRRASDGLLSMQGNPKLIQLNSNNKLVELTGEVLTL